MHDESVKTYKIRLCENKDIYDLSWNEISYLINKESGDRYDESYYRKWWNGYSEGFEDCRLLGVDDNALIMQYEEKRIQFEKEKIKFFDQRTAYNARIRHDARQEVLYDIIAESLKNVKPYQSKVVENIHKFSENDLLIGLNDIHFGANISNDWNIYNSDVAKERFEKYLSSIRDIKNTHNPEKCYVCGNGDLISGNIHKTIQISNKENVIEQVMGVSELIAWFLSELSNDFIEVIFVAVSGNHSRLSKKDESPLGERLDDLMPWYIKARLQNVDNIKILETGVRSTFNIINIRGLNYLNVHGDMDHTRTIHRITEMVDEEIYCVHMGHLHRNYTDSVGKYKIIMSGSFQGMDDFCVEKRIYSKAQQLVCVCNSNGILCHYDIILQG